MHAYLIILEITPLKTGSVHDTLPLHCTLVHWFWLQQDSTQLAKQLSNAVRGISPLLLTAGDQQVFTGKNKNGQLVPVTVNDITLTPELQSLHEHVCNVLQTMDVRYAEPQYVHNGFHPHVTHQKDGALSSGQAHTSTKLYLIEAAAPEYGNDRTVRAAITLN